MHPINSNSSCEESILEDEDSFLEFKESGKCGISVINKPYGHIEEDVSLPDTGDFVKWLHANNPEIPVDVQEKGGTLVLHSSDFWLPLVFLASDVTLPIYLNLVSNYLYDKSRGLLKGERARVHMSVVYEDSEAGKVKSFDFEGDMESLQKAIKKFDLNKFMD